MNNGRIRVFQRRNKQRFAEAVRTAREILRSLCGKPIDPLRFVCVDETILVDNLKILFPKRVVLHVTPELEPNLTASIDFFEDVAKVPFFNTLEIRHSVPHIPAQAEGKETRFHVARWVGAPL